MKIILLSIIILTLSSIQVQSEKVQDSFHILKLGEEDTVKLQRVIRGKNVLINFWATWCEPCKEEIPAILRAFSDNENIEILFISIDGEETKSKVIEMAEKFGIKDRTYLDDSSSGIKLYTGGTPKVPVNLVVDKNGNVLYKGIGYKNSTIQKMKAVVEKLR